MWAVAQPTIAWAESVVCIGVSLPASDYVFRWMMREASGLRGFAGIPNSQPHLTVVNPDDDAGRRAAELLGCSDFRWVSTFDDFINGKEGERVEARSTPAPR